MMIGSFVNVTLATSVMSTRNSVKLFDITLYVDNHDNVGVDHIGSICRGGGGLIE